MAYMSRVWMAASFAVVQGRSDRRGVEWHAGLRHLHLRAGWPSTLAPAALRPAPASVEGRDPCAGEGRRDERRPPAEESVRRALFVSCWATG